MSTRYGVTIHLSGPEVAEDKCVAELAASLRQLFKDRDGEVSYTLPVIPGSYWAKVRKGDEHFKTDDIVVTYMMTTPEFWSRWHGQAIEHLATEWPSLTLFMYGDSFENGDGFRLLFVEGKLIVDDVFHLDSDDMPTDVRRRVYGPGINAANLSQHLPEKYDKEFLEAEESDWSQTWEEVRAEVAASLAAGESLA